MVPSEGGVHLVVGQQQLLDQLLLAEPGDRLDDPVLHLLTNAVELLRTQPDRVCVGGGAGPDVSQTSPDQVKATR